jgi:hypothetical protein
MVQSVPCRFCITYSAMSKITKFLRLICFVNSSNFLVLVEPPAVEPDLSCSASEYIHVPHSNHGLGEFGSECAELCVCRN